MKIALVSYEYPPDTAFGGIATYILQTARTLADAGHQVEVFSGSETSDSVVTEYGYTVHRAVTDWKGNFYRAIAPIFARRHGEVGFDVMEVPDYNADARDIVRLVPDIPMVLKLHTPMFMTELANSPPLSLGRRIRGYLGAIRRRKAPSWHYDRDQDVEYAHALHADEYAAPCRAIGVYVGNAWSLDPTKISVVPLIFKPLPVLGEIPLDTDYKRITFIGRLEARKGVLDLMAAIPVVLERHPEWKFRLVGRPQSSPDPELDMLQYLERGLKQYSASVEFTGGVTPDQIPVLLGETDICVFPSIWENFPCSCLEAMAAGRAVVGSNAGGMEDMLGGGSAGKLIPPRSPEKLADAIGELILDRSARISLASAARQRLAAEYDPTIVLNLQLASYQRAIERRRAAGARLASE